MHDLIYMNAAGYLVKKQTNKNKPLSFVHSAKQLSLSRFTQAHQGPRFKGWSFSTLLKIAILLFCLGVCLKRRV